MSKQKVKTSVKTRVRKSGNSGGYKVCNICKGTGVVKSKGKAK